MITKATKAALCASIAIALSASANAADSERQASVERNSERVMPFSMAATMHRFVRTPTGGVQTVVVRHGDLKQIALVRSHLRKEARAFEHGDFADPAAIHGGAMPGLAAMHAGAHRINVRYADVLNGAAITYSTNEPTLVSAIHAWFKAQVSDHGPYATMNM